MYCFADEAFSKDNVLNTTFNSTGLSTPEGLLLFFVLKVTKKESWLDIVLLYAIKSFVYGLIKFFSASFVLLFCFFRNIIGLCFSLHIFFLCKGGSLDNQLC